MDHVLVSIVRIILESAFSDIIKSFRTKASEALEMDILYVSHKVSAEPLIKLKVSVDHLYMRSQFIQCVQVVS